MFVFSRHACAAVLALSAAVSVIPLTAVATVQSAVGSFVSHRAYYEMQLGKTSSQSKIIGAEGRMAFEWREKCDGWVVQQQYFLRFTDADGNVRDLNSRYANYESKDGQLYQFYVRKNGSASVDEEIKGTAGRNGQEGDAAGVATFSSPEDLRIDLSEGTLYPSAHTFALIDAAIAGRKFFAAKIFDGSEVEPESIVTAAIGTVRERTGTGFEAADGPGWPVRLAFFDPADTGAEPTYEMEVDLLENGIARSIMLDYGDYEIDVMLSGLEGFDPPHC